MLCSDLCTTHTLVLHVYIDDDLKSLESPSVLYFFKVFGKLLVLKYAYHQKSILRSSREWHPYEPATYSCGILSLSPTGRGFFPLTGVHLVFGD